MDIFFNLEDFAKQMLLQSLSKEEEENWQHVLENNRSIYEKQFIN